MPFKLGKTAPTPENVKLKFSAYVDESKLPKPPRVLGHTDLLPHQIGMLANDSVGDCVVAGAAHETMLFNAEAGRSITFTDQSCLSDYSAVTGYDPADPSTDQGTNVSEFVDYRTKVGVLDQHGLRHRIGGSVRIDPGHLDQYAEALFLFSAVGIGVQLPDSAQQQFAAEQPWDVVRGAQIEGGHYVPVVARTADGFWLVATWGRLQKVTDAFLTKYSDEAYAYLSLEFLGNNGKSLEGFNAQQLRADLADID
jgi:hypothetical protein